jgi:hypothetical protein
VGVTSLIVERIETDTTRRAGRALEHARQRSVDDLGGRTVWCAAALPAGRRRAEALRAVLERSSVRVQPLPVASHGRLEALAEQLAEVLASAAASLPSLGAAERQLYGDAVDAGEDWLGQGVGRDDVVVLHDPLVAVLAGAAREQGARAIWHVGTHAGAWPARASEALGFLHGFAGRVDAYLVASYDASGPTQVVERIAAFMPAPDVVAEHDIPLGRFPAPARLGEPAGRHDLGWASLLAQVVERGRDETVGGRLHPRPAVAVR